MKLREVGFSLTVFLLFAFLLEGGARLFPFRPSRHVPIAEARFRNMFDAMRYHLHVVESDRVSDLLLADADLFWTFRPGVAFHIDAYGRRGELRINSLGIRDDEPLSGEGVFRIVALGDSSTFGMGVGQEESYPEVLERLLKARCGDTPIEVLNAGTIGYTSWQGLKWLERHGPSLRPAIVTFAFGTNDATRTDGRSDLDIEVGRGAAVIENVLRRSEFYLLLQNFVEGVKPRPKRFDRRVPLPDFVRVLGRIVREAKRYGTPVFVNLPYNTMLLPDAEIFREPGDEEAMRRNRAGVAAARQGDFERAVAHFKAAVALAPHFVKAALNLAEAEFALGAYGAGHATLKKLFGLRFPHIPPYQEAAQKTAALLGIPVADVERFVSSRPPEDLFLPNDFCHPNVRGHERIAEVLLETIEDLLPSACRRNVLPTSPR